MQSILFRMQETAQQYVEILRDILDIDVNIIDAQRIRVAASGRMRAEIGKSMESYGSIVSHTLETKQTVVVEKAMEDPLCDGCPKRLDCDNLSEIWSPILVEDRAIGVIGCVCRSEEQRGRFLEKRELFTRFFEQFSGLLESKAHDLLAAERDKNILQSLEHILSRVQLGILILDARDHVVSINEFGRKILHLGPDDACQAVTIRPAGQERKKEYTVQSGSTVRTIVADVNHLGLGAYDHMLLFADAELRSDESNGLLDITTPTLNRMIGASPGICALKKSIQAVAPSSSNILVTGESGTGKELVARAIHEESQRKDGPFVAVNCAALPENLLESELFGYVKGAFTGASSSGKAGLFETAQGGTFFMDEIGDMPLPLQVKLLRVLEQREIRRLGSNKPIPINIRFVFATNRNLEEMIEAGTFRKDLYYRINVVPLTIPPLRERGRDVRLIAGSFIRKFCVAMGKTCSGVSDDFWAVLESYRWPGNVRELQNAIEYAINMMPSSGLLRSELLRRKLSGREVEHVPVEPLPQLEDWNLSHIEARVIQQCLTQCSGERDAKRLAAQKLGISRATLYRKIQEYGL